MEASALVPTPDSGSVWTLSLGNGENATSVTGVFSPVGTNWTTVSTTFPVVGDVAGYVDANGEMLISVSCSQLDSTQVGQVRSSSVELVLVSCGCWLVPRHLFFLLSLRFSESPTLGSQVSVIRYSQAKTKVERSFRGRGRRTVYPLERLPREHEARCKRHFVPA